MPDWLSGLRADSSESSPSIEPPGSEPDAVPGEQPDWLARIRGSQPQEPAGEEDDWLKQFSSSEDASPEENAPDWLKGQSADSAPGTPAPEETPDWLKGFQSGSPAAAEEPAAPSSSDDDWLKSFQSGETAPAAPKEDTQDWMQSFRAESAPEQPDSAASDDAWLKSFQASYPAGEQPAAEPPPDEPPANGETPDWLKGSTAQAEPPAPLSTGGEGWLNDLRGDTPETPARQPDQPLQPAEPASPAPAVPDWINNWGAVPPSNGVQAPPPAAGGGAADWLQGQDPTGGGTPPPAAGTPDWLSSLPAEPPAPAGDSGGLPDWLSTLPVEEPQPAKDEPASGASPFTFENQSAGSGGDTEPPASASPFVETGIHSTSPAEEPPDWLKAFASNLPAEEEPPAPVAPEAAGPAALPFGSADLPDWLSDEENPSAPLSEEPVSQGAGEGEGNLEEAQLPGWLQAMRPVEAVVLQGGAAASQPGKIEKSGPLAGLVNALPGEDLVTQVRKPPAYSSKLQVSERQRQSADLIEQMLSEEARPQPPRSARSRVPERAVRAIIAIVLVAVLFLPLLAGTGVMPLPSLFPPETVAFHTLLKDLPENTSVLLAVDYEPGLSGELSLAATPVVNQLAAHKARAVVLSTVPTGPALAESLLEAPRKNGLQVVDLGFLPGGMAGLQEFSLRPQLALRYTVSGEEAWTEANGLAGVDNLQKFSAVIVLTENAETARSWIEQVQPSLGSVPLLFVASAQAAPMIQPYIDSGQVRGMVSGMAGGVMYAGIDQSAGLSAGYWDAYQFGLFAGVILILLGGLAQVFAVMIRRPAGKRRA